MKKQILLFLSVVLFAGLNLNAQSQMCYPDVDYNAYACISKVEMNGVVSETSAGIPGETDFIEDFTNDPARLFKVVAGETYELEVTFSNFNSGVTDYYYIAVQFDWNNNLLFENNKEERYMELFSAGKQGGFVKKTFNVTVPADAEIDKVHMRVMTFYYEDGYPTDDLCDWIESGQIEDYLVEVSTGSGLKDLNSNKKESFFANPVNDVVNFDIPVNQYSIYSLDGRLVSEGQSTTNSINVSDFNSGVYILRAVTEEGVKVSNLIKK